MKHESLLSKVDEVILRSSQSNPKTTRLKKSKSDINWKHLIITESKFQCFECQNTRQTRRDIYEVIGSLS